MIQSTILQSCLAISQRDGRERKDRMDREGKMGQRTRGPMVLYRSPEKEQVVSLNL